MRSALLLSGFPRFCNFFDSQLENLQNSEIDWFVVFWKLSEPKNHFVHPLWYDVNCEKDAVDLLLPYLPANHRIKHFEFIDPSLYFTLPKTYTRTHTSPLNVFQQFTSLKICNQRRIDSNEIYELVIRSRPDIELDRPLDLKTMYDFLKKNPNKIYTPENQRHGSHPPLCDMFAIGLPEEMNKYCNSINLFDKIYDSGIEYSQERLLQAALQRQGIDYCLHGFKIYLRTTNHVSFGRWANLKIGN